MSQTYFCNDWLSKPDYADWLQAVPGDNKVARCKLCFKTFGLSNMGVGAIKSHMEGKKHQSIKSPAAFFGSVKKKSKSDTDQKEGTQKQQSTAKHARPSTNWTLDIMMKDDSVTRAEIIWPVKVIMSSYSLSSCSGISKLFQTMFPDSKIAEHVTLSNDKCSYMICYGIAPYLQSVLMDELKETQMYVVSFDESMNSVTQNEQMDINVRFWHPTKNRVEVWYLDSMFLGHTAARNLLHNFNLATSKLSAPNMIQVSMDGPNVNWAFYNLLKSREEKELSSLATIGSCGLHIMHGAFKAGAEATGWNVAKRLKALWTLFRDTPARRDDYVEYTGSNVFPLQFCATRWIEDEPVALQAVEIWENVEKIVRYWESLPKSK